ncbi:MAG: hypothetical protein EXR79_16800 [Myxococcales bacterium]|nr:hypothetical protein [Myxococcales bacterium]
MPPWNAPQLKTLSKAAFKAHNVVLPVDWEQPTGDAGKQYVDSFKLTELFAPPDPAKLFVPATPNKYHVDTVKKISGQFEAFIDGVCDAICNAISMWKLQAKFKDLKINAVTALGVPGCLDGPETKPFVLMTAPKASANENKYSKAVATHFSEAFKKWQDKVTVPGLPWYPAFAAFPGPMAPPMPNVPTPLIACPSAMMSEMTPSSLKDGFVKKLGDKKAQHHEVLFDALGKGIAAIFMMWLPQQQIMLVLGKGSIPTFAPPYVPVGPVVMGDNIAAPGHLMS